jgi:hypothetical protein
MKYASLLTLALVYSLGCGSKAPETEVVAPEPAVEPAPPAPPPEPTEEEKKKAEELKKLEEDRATMKADNEKDLARWTPELRADAKSTGGSTCYRPEGTWAGPMSGPLPPTAVARASSRALRSSTPDVASMGHTTAHDLMSIEPWMGSIVAEQFIIVDVRPRHVEGQATRVVKRVAPIVVVNRVAVVEERRVDADGNPWRRLGRHDAAAEHRAGRHNKYHGGT